MNVSIEGLSYLVLKKASNSWINFSSLWTNQERSLLLNDVNMCLRGGSVTCLLGTGEGMTNLLELIALRPIQGFMSGCILHDSLLRPINVYSDISYVPIGQDSVYFDGLSVFDYLYYGARLRLQVKDTNGHVDGNFLNAWFGSSNELQCRERTREVLKVLGGFLDGGLKLHRLRKGELRLLSVAMELLGSPTLLVLENPFFGLEYAEALNVARCLYKVSRLSTQPTTVIYTADGVNEEILRCVDNIQIFTGMRLSFSISFFEYALHIPSASARTCQNKDSNASSIVSINERVNKLHKLVTDASAELLRRPKHLRTALVEDNLLKMCADMNQLKVELQEALNSLSSTSSGLGDRRVSVGIEVESHPLVSRVSLSPAMSGGNNGSEPLPFIRSDSFVSASRRGLPAYKTTTVDVIKSKERKYHSVLREISVLCRREVHFTITNSFQARMSIGRSLLIGLLLGAAAYNDYNKINNNEVDDDDFMDDNGSGTLNQYVYNIQSCLFAMVFLIMLGITPVVGYLHTYGKILKIEVMSGYVREVSCWVSMLLFNVVLFLAATVMLGGILWGLLGFQGPESKFFGLIILGMLGSYSLAALCAFWSSSSVFATRVYILLCGCMLGVSGYFRNVNDLPSSWSFITNSAISRWLYEGLMVIIFTHMDDNDAAGSNYLESIGFNANSLLLCTTWVGGWFGVLQLLVVCGLTPPSYKLKKVRNSILNTVDAVGQKMHHKDEAQSITSGNSNMINPLNEGAVPEVIDNAAIGPASAYIPTTVVNQDAQAKFYASSGITSKRLAVKPLQLEDNPFRKVDCKATQRTTLTFSRVKYINMDAEQPETILEGISGTVSPGETCCILDSNDAGAGNILLKVISGRASAAGVVQGVIKANGTTLAQNYSLVFSAFVARGDGAHQGHLTVKQTIIYAALLRRTDQRSCSLLRYWVNKQLYGAGAGGNDNDYRYGLTDDNGRPMGSAGLGGTGGYVSQEVMEEQIGSSNDLEKRVEDVLLMMGLETLSDVQIGVEGERNLSPSQLRCLTIAVELVNKPSLLFIEDPTHDLDWHHASVVANAIKTLALGGRNIILTLSNRPTQAVFESFDKCILLGDGHMIYFGHTLKAVPYFSNIGYVCGYNENPAEMVMNIGAGKGVMKKVEGNGENTGKGSGSRRGYVAGAGSSTLSVLDLADLCRSYNHDVASSNSNAKGSDLAAHLNASMKSKQQSRFGGIGTRAHLKETDTERQSAVALGSSVVFVGNRGVADEENDGVSGVSRGGALVRTTPTDIAGAAVGLRLALPPVGPTSRTNAQRTLQVLVSDYWGSLGYLSRFAVTGLVVGWMFYSIEDGDYLTRMSMFAVSFLSISVIMTDLMEGIHRRKSIFLRERASRVATGLSYWISDSIPFQILNVVGVVTYCAPVYYLAGLRPTVGNFLMFLALMMSSTYCNLGLIYFVCMITPDGLRSRLVFGGILLPLQALLSSYLILAPTMPLWTTYVAYIFPMSYFCAGTMRNEFQNYGAALGDTTYGELEDFYDYHATIPEAIIGIVTIGIGYRVLWLVVLKMWEVMKRREVLRKVGVARKKAKWFFSIPLRWRNSPSKNRSMEQDILAQMDEASSSPYHNMSNAPAPVLHGTRGSAVSSVPSDGSDSLRKTPSNGSI